MAEMLALVCHQEYFIFPEHMVRFQHISNWAKEKVFVMHVSGFNVSFYWTVFKKNYLETVWEKPLEEVKKLRMVKLFHMCPLSLLRSEQRDDLIVDFLSIVRFLVQGKGKVGFFRDDADSPIHRGKKE